MKTIKQSFKIIPQDKGLEGIYKQIELGGKVCYQSTHTITEDSAKRFVEDVLIKNEHCYTGNVQVLTSKGWVYWKDYSGEPLAVINKDLSFKGFELPFKIIKKEYEGNFYFYPELGIEVTDGHNMFGVFRGNNNDFYNNTKYELFSCNENSGHPKFPNKTLGERMFKVPACCSEDIESSVQGEFLGFWLGDGCHDVSSSNTVRFHLKKRRKIEYLKSLAIKLNFKFKELKNNHYCVIGENLNDFFNKYHYYQQEKYIDINLCLDKSYIKGIILGLLNSDGYIKENKKTLCYSTTSKYIKDWLEVCAPLVGYNISTTETIRDASRKILYNIFLLDTSYYICNDSRKPNSKVIIRNKKDQVYCASVSTGLILVKGTSGRTIICGNCRPLEHGTVYLNIHWDNNIHTIFEDIFKFYNANKYSKCIREVVDTSAQSDLCPDLFITTNMRVLVENDRLDDLKYLCEPTEYHEKRVTVNVVCDRQIQTEIKTHTTLSSTFESTRFCNYNKDKFGNELTFIESDNFPNIEIHHSPAYDNTWEVLMSAYEEAEAYYMTLIEAGVKPQFAAKVLPFGIKGEGYITGFISDWIHFFNMRTPINAHPDIQDISKGIKEEFIKLGYIND